MLLDRVKNFIDPSEIEIHIYKNGIYVINYTLISNFSENKIEIHGKNDLIKIIGNNLIISKLKKDELFISGEMYELILR